MSETLREFYKKVRLIRRSEQKEIWLIKNTLDGELAVAKIQQASAV